MTDKRIVNVLSLGAGVQSSTMLLMACHGEIPKPDLVVFSDTGWEPKRVYDWLDWLTKEAAKFGVEIVTTAKGNIKEDTLEMAEGRRRRLASMPFFVRNEDGKQGRLHRMCTKEYKIEPVIKATRLYLGYEPRKRVKEDVRMWMGISTDEIIRVKPSRTKWVTNEYPLIEHNMSRMDCLKWMSEHGYLLPPKSSCIGCPYHGNDFWRDMRDNHPEEWAEAVEFDKRIRRISRVNSDVYVHRSMKPLDEVNLDSNDNQQKLDLFEEECEGMCGV